jgi:hypothetical protein
MAHHHMFSEVYFNYRLKNHAEVKRRLLEQYNVSDSENEAKWNCNSTRIELTRDDILPSVTPALKEFGDELRKSAKIFMDSCWMNFYRMGAFQELHNHVVGGCQLALVYFLNYNKKTDGKFYFYNTNTEIISTEIATLLSGPVGSFGSVLYPKVDEGDVLIFPSYMHHGVSPHNGDDLRVTVSCNLRFQIN